MMNVFLAVPLHGPHALEPSTKDVQCTCTFLKIYMAISLQYYFIQLFEEHLSGPICKIICQTN